MRCSGGTTRTGGRGTPVILGFVPAAHRVGGAVAARPHALIVGAAEVPYAPQAPNGVLGDPTGATAEVGEELLELAATQLAAEL